MHRTVEICSVRPSPRSSKACVSIHETMNSGVEDLDEGFVMFVGADVAGNLLEIGVVDSADGPIIVHAMTARPKYLR